MISKEEFNKLIEDHIHWSNRIDEVSKVLNFTSLFECDWIDYAAQLFENTINMLFTNDGIDTINWWIYDKRGRSDFKMWDKDDNEIPTETIDDLWNIIKKYRK